MVTSSLLFLKMTTRVCPRTAGSGLSWSGWRVLLLSSLEQFNRRNVTLRFLCFVIFLFKAKQHNLGFSDTEHLFCCCEVPSCCIFYAIPFLKYSLAAEERFLGTSSVRVAEGRDASSGCASFLSLTAALTFPAVPLVCKLPAFIPSANMYKM